MNPIYQYWWLQSVLIDKRSKYVDEDWDPAGHDQRVLMLIKKYIEQSSSPKNSITDNLGAAVTAVISDRESSTDLVDMPDASYYLQARYEISKDRSPATQLLYAQGGIALTYFYNILKIPIVPANRALGTHVLESKKGVPNSPATLSSVKWVKRG